MNHDRLPSIDHSAESGLDPNLFAEAATDQPGEKPLDPNKFIEAVPTEIHDETAEEEHDPLGSITTEEAEDAVEVVTKEGAGGIPNIDDGALEKAVEEFEIKEQEQRARIEEVLKKAQNEAGKTPEDLRN